MKRILSVFLTDHEWDFVQSILAQDKPAGTKYCWHLIYEIDKQTGGKYGKNWIR